MTDLRTDLRIALVAGTLAQGGAEKQLVYMAQALKQAGADVRVYSLTRDEFYQNALQTLGLAPEWIGQFTNPLLRLGTLISRLRHFQPHIIQSTHSYANLYVSLTGRLLGTLSIGALRCSLRYSYEDTGNWNKLLMTTPTALIANSQSAIHELIASSLIEPERLYLVPNVIDIPAFDITAPPVVSEKYQPEGVTAVFVARLVGFKRLDRFLRALSIAYQREPSLKGVVVGDGSERHAMEALAAELNLLPNVVTFLGQRSDVPVLLRQADMQVLTSDGDEGFPNAILEAMTASLPVITTPAGDAGFVVQDGLTGYVVPFDDVEGIADRMVRLAKSRDLCRQLGQAGRQRVEQLYSFEGLTDSLLGTYRTIAKRQGYPYILGMLSR